ncbi:MAG: YbaB/EbfC family nucleoid-associated protein [Selenomonadaceae bacterium]|nr:YbaB/EbfC family nucleoid-associated protein [Selenomonadaceae bacterium]
MAQPPKINMNDLLKKAQELEKTFKASQEKLKAETATVSVGGNMVTVTVDGEKNVKEIKIDPELVKDGDVEAIQDLVMSAINSANAEIEKKISDKMNALAMPALDGIPGLSGLFGK